MKKIRPALVPALGLFVLFVWQAESARAGAWQGVKLCAELLVPALLPFFVAAGLLTRLGFAEQAERLLGPGAARLFGVSGAGAAAFVLGLTGGYPLGAAAVADLVRTGRAEKKEAQKLLRFCDNTGPSFAVGALGAGVFGSPGAGMFLWLVHGLAAVLTGVLLSFPRQRGRAGAPGPAAPPESLAAALSGAVQNAAAALPGVCAFVVFFSAFLAVLDSLGLPGALAGRLAGATGAELGWCRALLTGLWELSGGVGAMRGLPVTPANLALGAFLLGWGGVCVHCQAMAVTAGTGLDTAGRLGGKLLHGVLSALLAYGLAGLFF